MEKRQIFFLSQKHENIFHHHDFLIREQMLKAIESKWIKQKNSLWRRCDVKYHNLIGFTRECKCNFVMKLACEGTNWVCFQFQIFILEINFFFSTFQHINKRTPTKIDKKQIILNRQTSENFHQLIRMQSFLGVCTLDGFDFDIVLNDRNRKVKAKRDINKNTNKKFSVKIRSSQKIRME